MAIPQRLAPSTKELRQFYVGTSIDDVPKPALVLDVAKARRHCKSMLDAAKALGVGFRAHVKTHKVSKTLKDIVTQQSRTQLSSV